MEGKFKPLSDEYSEEIVKLVGSMLNKDPSVRPTAQ